MNAFDRYRAVTGESIGACLKNIRQLRKQKENTKNALQKTDNDIRKLNSIIKKLQNKISNLYGKLTKIVYNKYTLLEFDFHQPYKM